MAVGCHTLPQTCRWLSMCGYFWFTVGWTGSQKEQRLVPISVWAGHSGWTGTQDFSVLSKPDGKCLERVTMRIAKTPCTSAESRKWQWANSGLTQRSACWMGRDWPLAYYLLASASPDASVLTFFKALCSWPSWMMDIVSTLFMSLKLCGLLPSHWSIYLSTIHTTIWLWYDPLYPAQIDGGGRLGKSTSEI